MVKRRKRGGGLWKTMKRAFGIKSKKGAQTKKYWKNEMSNSNSNSKSISRSASDKALIQFNRKGKKNTTQKSLFNSSKVKGKVSKRETIRNPLLQKVLTAKKRNSSSRSSSRSSSESPPTLYQSMVSKKLKSFVAPEPPSKTSDKFLTIINEEHIRNSSDIPVTKLELSNGSTILVNEIESIEIIGFNISKGTIDINIKKTIENTHKLKKEDMIRGIRIKNDTLLTKMKSVVNRELEEFVKIRDSKFPKSKDLSSQYTYEGLHQLKEKFKNAVEIKN